jgi:hypothetical protein
MEPVARRSELVNASAGKAAPPATANAATTAASSDLMVISNLLTDLVGTGRNRMARRVRKADQRPPGARWSGAVTTAVLW